MWQPQIDAFQDRYRLVVPDLPGFGTTPLPPQPFSHVDDLHQMITGVGVESAVWVGCSMGGSVVLDLALAHPEVVASLVLVDTLPSGHPITDPITRAGWQAAERAYAEGDLVQAAQVEMEMWLVGPHREPDAVPPALRQLVADMILVSYEHGEGDSIDPDEPAAGRLAEVAVPVLVIAGAHDQADFRAGAGLIADRIRHARLEVIDDAAHLPSLERPDEFNELLAGFLASPNR